MGRTEWVSVDLDGLAKIMGRHGHGWVLRELLQNAFDEPVTNVDVTIERIVGQRACWLTVTDDSPEGFQRLSDAWTLFGESLKVKNPLKAGRFLAGEKFVLACCETAEIRTTTGSVLFEGNRRRVSTAKHHRTTQGTIFRGKLRLTRSETDTLMATARQVIVPAHVTLTVDGVEVQHRQPLETFSAYLNTVVADPVGSWRTEYRFGEVVVYDSVDTPSGGGWLYELGLPVVKTMDRFDIDVRQKIPLSIERDNVSAAYLLAIRTEVLNHCSGRLTTADATAQWVRDASGSYGVEPEALATVLRLRFGDKVTSFDPSDIEASKRAVAEGYAVVHGGALSADEWDQVRRHKVMLPAGQITPTPRPFDKDGRPLDVLDVSEWPAWGLACDRYVRHVSAAILNRDIVLMLVNARWWPHEAAYGRVDNRLYINLAHVGREWFANGPTPAVNALLIHELAHGIAPADHDHLSESWHDALCKVGAQLTDLALRNQTLFCGLPSSDSNACNANDVGRSDRPTIIGGGPVMMSLVAPLSWRRQP